MAEPPANDNSFDGDEGALAAALADVNEAPNTVAAAAAAPLTKRKHRVPAVLARLSRAQMREFLRIHLSFPFTFNVKRSRASDPIVNEVLAGIPCKRVLEYLALVTEGDELKAFMKQREKAAFVKLFPGGRSSPLVNPLVGRGIVFPEGCTSTLPIDGVMSSSFALEMINRHSQVSTSPATIFKEVVAEKEDPSAV